MPQQQNKKTRKLRGDVIIFSAVLIIFAGLIIASTYNRHYVNPKQDEGTVSFQFNTYSKSDTPLSSEAVTSLININTANADELDSLPGIGAKKAQAIIDYRENTGTFKSITDIKNVTGIGDGIFEQIKDLITVG